MKQATVILSLTKNHQVTLTGVTPIMAMLLVAEHHVASGGNPVEVLKDSVEEIKIETESKDAAGKVTKTSSTRTEDDEVSRLKGKFGAKKVTTLCQQVRTFPKDFDEAVKKGLELVLPSEALASVKL